MPPGVVTVTSTVPVPVGATAEMDVAETTLKDVAALAPNFTAVAPVKFVPVTVTVVPPEVDPEDGLIKVTVGTPVVPTDPWAAMRTATTPETPVGLCVADGCWALDTLTSKAATSPSEVVA